MKAGVLAGDLPHPFPQLSRAERFSSEQFARLALALTVDPELRHAWRLLQQLFGADSEDDAGIESFVHALAQAPIPEFRAVLKAFAQWLPEILAFHWCGRITNGRLEGRTTSSAWSRGSRTGS